jgi:hypothetical protein
MLWQSMRACWVGLGMGCWRTWMGQQQERAAPGHSRMDAQLVLTTVVHVMSCLFHVCDKAHLYSDARSPFLTHPPPLSSLMRIPVCPHRVVVRAPCQARA